MMECELTIEQLQCVKHRANEYVELLNRDYDMNKWMERNLPIYGADFIDKVLERVAWIHRTVVVSLPGLCMEVTQTKAQFLRRAANQFEALYEHQHQQEGDDDV